MAVKPLDDRVLIKQCEAEEMTAGGIVLPDSAQEKPQMASLAIKRRNIPIMGETTMWALFME